MLGMDPCQCHHIFASSGEYLPPFPVNIGEPRSLVVTQIHVNPFHCDIHHQSSPEMEEIARDSCGACSPHVCLKSEKVLASAAGIEPRTNIPKANMLAIRPRTCLIERSDNCIVSLGYFTVYFYRSSKVVL